MLSHLCFPACPQICRNLKTSISVNFSHFCRSVHVVLFRFLHNNKATGFSNHIVKSNSVHQVQKTCSQNTSQHSHQLETVGATISGYHEVGCLCHEDYNIFKSSLCFTFCPLLSAQYLVLIIYFLIMDPIGTPL